MVPTNRPESQRRTKIRGTRGMGWRGERNERKAKKDVKKRWQISLQDWFHNLVYSSTLVLNYNATLILSCG
ncbi:hypothetical protein PAHAL_3G287200 [Panicum hallii]|uniref:Uncharacterized protein n=1 Tax=Panicum hallii TaxID=206008 RepID=A0A2T8KJS2_9POAL|nr:hypothetical protein PAHAL_3G287200 [Panicum hallii]